MKAILSADRNWGIGNGNKLLVSIPSDMKFFRQTTTGKVVVMGRKTLESFPNGQPLKNRTNIVLTENPDYRVKDAVIVHSKEELLKTLEQYDTEDIYIIGGESTPFLHQLHGIVVEQKTHLVFRIGGTIEAASHPELAVSTVFHFIQSVRQHSCLHIGLQIGPQSNLGAIQRRLFHHRQRAIGAFRRSGKQQFRLVGGITQEVSFKNRHGSGQFFFQ